MSDNRQARGLYTLPAAGEYIGCSAMHVRRLIALGELRAINIATPGAGRTKMRVRPEDLDAYINSRAAMTAEAAAQ